MVILWDFISTCEVRNNRNQAWAVSAESFKPLSKKAVDGGGQADSNRAGRPVQSAAACPPPLTERRVAQMSGISSRLIHAEAQNRSRAAMIEACLAIV